MLKKLFALLMCLLLTLSCAAAEEGFEAPELTEEELEAKFHENETERDYG